MDQDFKEEKPSFSRLVCNIQKHMDIDYRLHVCTIVFNCMYTQIYDVLCVEFVPPSF